MISKQKSLLAIVSSLVAPGMGTAMISNLWLGLAGYIAFALLWIIPLGGWLGISLHVAIWALFASVDIAFVSRIIKRFLSDENVKQSNLLLRVLGFLFVVWAIYCAMRFLAEPLLFGRISLLLPTGALGLVVGDWLYQGRVITRYRR